MEQTHNVVNISQSVALGYFSTFFPALASQTVGIQSTYAIVEYGVGRSRFRVSATTNTMVERHAASDIVFTTHSTPKDGATVACFGTVGFFLYTLPCMFCDSEQFRMLIVIEV
jgi:hypothetical protein